MIQFMGKTAHAEDQASENKPGLMGTARAPWGLGFVQNRLRERMTA